MSDDPVRWCDAADPPEGALELVRSLDGPPPLPPPMRASVGARLRRATKPKTRWVGPTTLAVAVVIGGLVIWRFSRPAAPPTEPLSPDVQQIVADERAGTSPRDDVRTTTETPPAPEAGSDEAAVGATGEATALAADESPSDGPPPDEPAELPRRVTARAADESSPDQPAHERGRRRLAPAPADPQGEEATDSPRIAVLADAVEYGTLTINTMPWARVFIDGVHIGNTPIRRHRVRAGTHEITLETPDGQRRTERVNVRPEEDHRITRALGSERVDPSDSTERRRTWWE